MVIPLNWIYLGGAGPTIATPKPVSPTGSRNPTKNVYLRGTAFKAYNPYYYRTKREFQLATNSSFTSGLREYSPNSDSTYVGFRLAKATSYWWRCRDFTQVNGVKSPWSSIASFTTIPVEYCTLTYRSYDGRNSETQQIETEESGRVRSYQWNDISRPYRFSYWSCSAGGSYNAGDTISIGYNQRSITMRPNRELITWTVTLRDSNGSGTKYWTVQDGDSWTFPSNLFSVPDGFEFMGYGTSSSTASYKEGASVTISSNVTYYAIIRINVDGEIPYAFMTHADGGGGWANRYYEVNRDLTIGVKPNTTFYAVTTGYTSRTYANPSVSNTEIIGIICDVKEFKVSKSYLKIHINGFTRTAVGYQKHSVNVTGDISYSFYKVSDGPWFHHSIGVFGLYYEYTVPEMPKD